MAVLKQGGFGYGEGKISTTQGLKDNRPPLCWTCKQRKEGQIYGIDTHGAPICNDCAEAWLRGECPPETK